MMLRKALVACMAAACVGGAGAATFFPEDIVPAATFNWGSGGNPGDIYGNGNDINDQWGEIDLRAGGTVAVSGDFPRNGNGSLKFAANGQTNTKAGVAYYPPFPNGFGPLSGIAAASYDWYRSSVSDVQGSTESGVPVIRMFLFDPDTNAHVATLSWQPQNNGITVVSDTWTHVDVLGGHLWNTKTNSPALYAIPFSNPRTFAALQADADFGRLSVRSVEIGYGSGDLGPNFVGAADNVVFRGAAASVEANFEFDRPVVDAPIPTPTPVPTLGEWSLMALSSVLGGLALLRVRRSRPV